MQAPGHAEVYATTLRDVIEQVLRQVAAAHVLLGGASVGAAPASAVFVFSEWRGDIKLQTSYKRDGHGCVDGCAWSL